MTNIKTIYIAGKMKGKADYGRDFNEAEKRLTEQGYIVLNPASLPVGLPEKAYMPICLAMLEAADAIYMLKGWQDSHGANLELDYALYQGKKVHYEDEDERFISGLVDCWGAKAKCFVQDLEKSLRTETMLEERPKPEKDGTITNEEALALLKSSYAIENMQKVANKTKIGAYERAIDALERLVAQRSVKEGESERCPKCGARVYKQSFCGSCGQAIAEQKSWTSLY